MVLSSGEDGSMNPTHCLTLDLSQTFSKANPAFTSGSAVQRVLTKPSDPHPDYPHDNVNHDYILYVNDCLVSKDRTVYRILDLLGHGTFGQVVKCINTRTNESVAIKVIKNKTAYYKQSMVEVSILDLLNHQFDINDQHHLARMKDHFVYRHHLCIVFECLSVNLYELIKQNQFRGLSLNLVRVFVEQLLDALIVLNRARIIHCDLKPENILLQNLDSPKLKVIDFGSACHENQTMYTYIQSRFYRAPEILLGLPYNSSIDLWSLGCISAELFLGLPLFPGSSEYNQVSRIIEMLGYPPLFMCERGKHAIKFFDKKSLDNGQVQFEFKSMEHYSQEFNVQEEPSKRYFKQFYLEDIVREYPYSKRLVKQQDIEAEAKHRECFVDFLKGLLRQNPLERWTPQQARMHPFVTGETFKAPFTPPTFRIRMDALRSSESNVQKSVSAYGLSDIGNSPRVSTEHYSGDLNHPPKVPYTGQKLDNSYYRRPSNLDAIHQLPQQFHRSAGELRPMNQRASTSENIAQMMDKITITEDVACTKK